MSRSPSSYHLASIGLEEVAEKEEWLTGKALLKTTPRDDWCCTEFKTAHTFRKGYRQMPVYEVTIGNHPPLEGLLVPKMAQHNLRPKIARDGEYITFVGEN